MLGTTLPGTDDAGLAAGRRRRPLTQWLAAAALALGIAAALVLAAALQGDPSLLRQVDRDPRLWGAFAAILLLLMFGLVLGRRPAAAAGEPARDLRRPQPRPAPSPFAALIGPLAIEDLALLEDALLAADADTAWQAAQRLADTGRDLGLETLTAAAAALRDALEGPGSGEPAALLEAVRDGVAALGGGRCPRSGSG
jgi:hypothetical protein